MLFNEGRTLRIKIRVQRRAIKNSLANWTAITDGTIAGESVSLKRVLLNFRVYAVGGFVFALICDLRGENDMSDRPLMYSGRWFSLVKAESIY